MRPMTLPERNLYNKSVDVLTMPGNIRRLPISPLGWPVPYFVAWFDRDGKPCADGDGIPDFRITDPVKIARAIKESRCWICGQAPMGVYKCFVIGPMCSINRCISEPPSHRDCAIYAARICPFLAKPNMVRNESGGLYENGKLRDGVNEAAGHGLKRNPGAVCVWITKSFNTFRPDPGKPGILFSLGRPIDVMWFAHGRRATRKEVMDSIDSGYPLLEDIARQEGSEAIAALKTQREMAMALVPDA